MDSIFMPLTNNVLCRIYSSIQFVDVQRIAQFSFNLVVMFLMWHTETIRNLNDTLVNRT